MRHIKAENGKNAVVRLSMVLVLAGLFWIPAACAPTRKVVDGNKITDLRNFKLRINTTNAGNRHGQPFIGSSGKFQLILVFP